MSLENPINDIPYIRMSKLNLGRPTIFASFEDRKAEKVSPTNFEFPILDFTSDLVSDGNQALTTKTILLEVLTSTHKQIGSCQFALKDAFQRANQGKMQLFLLDSKHKLKGTLHVTLFQATSVCSFFDLVFRSRLNIVPVVGVDFSMANLTMNDDSFCNHSLKNGGTNDYIGGLKAIHSAYASLSEFKLAYGFGARTMDRADKSQHACDLFSMSGDMQDPFVTEMSELLNCYHGTLS